VAKQTLTAKSPLGGYIADPKGLSIREVTGFTTLSLGVFQGAENPLKAALKKKLKISLPDTAQASVVGDVSLLPVARDQWFLRFPEKDGDIAQDMAKDLKDLAAITDQSDSWAELELSGPKVIEKLVRLCPIDIHNDVFLVGAVARTSMEHLGVIMMRLEDNSDGQNRFLLLSPRSSAESFLHALVS